LSDPFVFSRFHAHAQDPSDMKTGITLASPAASHEENLNERADRRAPRPPPIQTGLYTLWWLAGDAHC
jgi:hypothetical protein